MLIFGGSQAVRRFNAAVADALPRLVERVPRPPRHAARTATRPRSPRASGCPPTSATRYRPYPFLRDEMLRGARRGGPRRRAGRLVDARRGHRARASRRSSSRIPTPRATRRANARVLADAGAARIVAGRGVRRRRARRGRRTCSVRRRRRPRRDGRRPPGGLGRPGAADAVAALVLALAERRPLPTADGDRARSSRGPLA